MEFNTINSNPQTQSRNIQNTKAQKKTSTKTTHPNGKIYNLQNPTSITTTPTIKAIWATAMPVIWATAIWATAIQATAIQATIM